MRKRWVGHGVNLNLLNNRIKVFLENRGFKTREKESTGGCSVVGISRGRDFIVKAVVRISGSPNDFSVEFVREEDKEVRLRGAFSSFLTLFGGGFLLSRDVKKLEILDRLERDFLVFLGEAVERLTRSEA